jgi:hypothetical protein
MLFLLVQVNHYADIFFNVYNRVENISSSLFQHVNSEAYYSSSEINKKTWYV